MLNEYSITSISSWYAFTSLTLCVNVSFWSSCSEYAFLISDFFWISLNSSTKCSSLRKSVRFINFKARGSSSKTRSIWITAPNLYLQGTIVSTSVAKCLSLNLFRLNLDQGSVGWKLVLFLLATDVFLKSKTLSQLSCAHWIAAEPSQPAKITKVRLLHSLICPTSPINQTCF